MDTEAPLDLADEGEESPEFLAELDARIRALDAGARIYSLAEVRRAICKSA